MMDRDSKMKGDTIADMVECETFETDSQENTGIDNVILYEFVFFFFWGGEFFDQIL